MTSLTQPTFPLSVTSQLRVECAKTDAERQQTQPLATPSIASGIAPRADQVTLTTQTTTTKNSADFWDTKLGITTGWAIGGAAVTNLIGWFSTGMQNAVQDTFKHTALSVEKSDPAIKRLVVGSFAFAAFGAVIGGSLGGLLSLFHRNKEQRLQDAQERSDAWRRYTQPTVIQTSTPAFTPTTTTDGTLVNTVATAVPSTNTTTIIQPPPAAYGGYYGDPYYGSGYHNHTNDVLGDLLLWNAVGNAFSGGGSRYSETNHYHHYYPSTPSSSNTIFNTYNSTGSRSYRSSGSGFGSSSSSSSKSSGSGSKRTGGFF